jgi:cysteine-rich repeat protein
MAPHTCERIKELRYPGQVRVAFALVVLLAGCITDPTIVCGTQRCSADQVCVPGGCATPAAAAACADRADNEACVLAPDELAVCIGGACRPTICGDDRTDPTEACDDGNTAAGDECSAQCDSNETCGNGVVDIITGEECDDGIVGLSGDGCSSACRLEQATWVDVSPQPLAGRAGAALAYDEEREVALLFGGFDTKGLREDTWVLRGDAWARLDPAVSPSARSEVAIAYDPARKRVVMFGGLGQVAILGDTWEWDGTTWTQRVVSVAPPPRRNAVMVYDKSRGRVVLIGGFTPSGVTNEVWEWDGTTWQQVVNGPGHNGPAATWDAARNYILYYCEQETWKREAGVWTKLAPATTPNTRSTAAMAYHGETSRSVMFGGLDKDGRYLGETWTWNGADWTNENPLDTAPPRSSPALAYMPGRVLLVGGYRYSSQAIIFDDTFVWQGGGWLQLDRSDTLAPSPRSYAAIGSHPPTGQLLVYSGRINLGADDWVWRDNVWQPVPTRTAVPDGRWGTSLVYDERRDVLVMFGGSTLVGPLAETWEVIPGDSWIPRTPSTSPPARDSHGMTYDAKRERVIVFGGYGATGKLADTWQWDGTEWTQLFPPTSPSARLDISLAYDPIRERVVLFGGYATTTLGDTWEFDGTTWQQIPTMTAPFPRSGYALAYDPARRRVVLFGGVSNSGGGFNDTWEWDGTSWTRVAIANPPPVRYGAAMAYEPAQRRMIVFGGYGFTDALNDTWALVYANASESTERCKVATDDLDGDDLVTCDDPDCWGRCRPLCPPATTCAASAPRCGDGTCSAVEDYLLCPTDCM